ncbi:MAG: cobyrinate a,c-diamide synthase [Tannerellaceae bacterium]|jgi:cobyrinic acid a,c-diamide synthase|nr:cobyrinate a,c-diamide synthase [Tannerellaceae bacterium]
MKSHFLIGAASSGSGKTTLTLGLLRALWNRGMQVQPFKCGPDYIDTRYHYEAAGKSSVNLDLFMMSKEYIRSLYSKYSTKADVTVTEGVMGLFDGYDGMLGSGADIARLLDIPVILVVNAKSSAYSVAPLIYGFKHFNKTIKIAGVIFNFVASENHYSFLKQAAKDAGIESLGYIPKQTDMEIPSRHLGLTMDNTFPFDLFTNKIAGIIEKHIDIDRLLELTRFMNINRDVLSKSKTKLPHIGQIAVARDEAFNFVYEENIQYLHKLGKVVFFSPLHDPRLPDASFIYLPGGYPELYSEKLSGNTAMHKAIRQYIEQEGKLLAECGGMMYLCDSITDKDGNTFPMAGILNQCATMEPMKLRLGYRTLYYSEYEMKGHEFHYSSVIPQKQPLSSVAKAFTAKGVTAETPLYRYKNVLAGYTHLYWADETTNDWFIHYLTS